MEPEDVEQTTTSAGVQFTFFARNDGLTTIWFVMREMSEHTSVRQLVAAGPASAVQCSMGAVERGMFLSLDSWMPWFKYSNGREE